ncbi:M14 family metallopeptidase [Rhizorhabdus wittichii]|uniref:M14 family metallopeptidase n=1 Tax=Rhizorhabdus wittichii TaxID=160791 RepID=UPI000370BB02|nr:M14 family metallopeptidase [Rhizorhabdus wittichii]
MKLRHSLPLLIAASVLALAPAPAVSVDPDRAPLPPERPWHGKSEALIAKAGDPWITPSEKTGLTATPSYAETRAYLERLAAASPLIRVETFGKTVEGRDMLVVIASKDGKDALDPAKPVLLAHSGIHPGEIDGKDASMMLLRDIALRGKDGLLDRVNFVFVPIFNIDGHERTSPYNRPNQRGPVSQGWRTTAQNINLNRDFMKADTPEMQALIGLFNRFDPTLYMDMHVSDGLDFQYDVTFGWQEPQYTHSPAINGWLERVYRTKVNAGMKAAGHIPGPLVLAADDRHPEKGLMLPAFPPRFSHGYGDLRHMPAILVEDHALKPYRQRVLGAYVLLEQTLRTLASDGAALKAAIAADRRIRGPETIAWKTKATPVRDISFLPMRNEYYRSPASGAEEVRWLGKPAPAAVYPLFGSEPDVTVTPPVAYWVSVADREVIDRLRLHGIRMEVQAQPRTVTVDMTRISDPKLDAAPTEDRVMVKAGGFATERRQETYPAGSVRVPTDQPLGALATMLLEPQGEDSLFGWGFFPAMLQRTEYIEAYVIAPMAEQMMARDPALKAAFEKKLAADPAFAADPEARLAWFYARTRYYDTRYLLYPVGREVGGN